MSFFSRKSKEVDSSFATDKLVSNISRLISKDCLIHLHNYFLIYVKVLTPLLCYNFFGHFYRCTVVSINDDKWRGIFERESSPAGSFKSDKDLRVEPFPSHPLNKCSFQVPTTAVDEATIHHWSVSNKPSFRNFLSNAFNPVS